MDKFNLQSLDYSRLISDLKGILAIEKVWGERALNHIKIQITWRVGERISQEFRSQEEGKKYGNAIYAKLAKDLNISKSHLFAAVKFFLRYPFPQYLSHELTWNHYKLLSTVDNDQIRRFYEIQSISNKWSVRELQKRIRSEEHKKIESSNVSLPSSFMVIPEVADIIKNSYNFDFIQLSQNYTEKNLEKSLINQIGKFLLELGSGFFFGGNQYRITISGNSHYIDLVFFHVHLSCYILIDLKIEKFQDSFVGQMNKYLRYFRERINLPYMRPPIGIIICKSMDAEEVYYALEGLERKIFIAEYQLYLPTREQIVTALQSNSSSNLTSLKISERQSRALAKLEKLANFQVNDYKRTANTSLSTAQRDIQNLVKEGVLTKKGKGRKTCYTINNELCSA